MRKPLDLCEKCDHLCYQQLICAYLQKGYARYAQKYAYLAQPKIGYAQPKALMIKRIALPAKIQWFPHIFFEAEI